MHGTLASSCLDPSYPMQKLERAEIQKLFALLLPVHELPPTLFIPPTPQTYQASSTEDISAPL